MRVLNFWRQVAAVLRHAAYPKTPVETRAEFDVSKVEEQLASKGLLAGDWGMPKAACKDHGAVVEVEAHGRTWYSGPPPHVGWWNAAGFPKALWAPTTWRWWDGKHWTLCRELGQHAYQTKCNTENIRWNDYYPEDAVVPRMTPEQWKERARASS